MKKNALFLAALQFAAAATVQAEGGAAPKFDLAIDLRQAVDLEREHALSEFTALMGVNWKPAAGWRMRAGTRAIAETQLERSTFRRVKVDEAYVEYAGDRCSTRAGAQQVVWGGADRLRVLDLIHPLDLRENLFGDPVQSRLSLAMFNTECSAGAQSIQLLFIPQSRNNLRPQPGSRFSVPLPPFQPGVATSPVMQGEGPDWKDPRDWSVGLKWAGRLGLADVTLNAFHGWQADPVTRRQSGAVATLYRAQSERFSMAGGSIAAPVGPFVLKAEASVVPHADGYYLDAARMVDATGSRERRALVGLDYQARNWFLSSQFYMQHNSAQQQLLDPEWQKIATLAARREFLQGRLNLAVYVAHDLVKPAQYVSIATKYDIRASWQGSLTFDYFRGNPLSLGRFHPETRLIFALRHDVL